MPSRQPSMVAVCAFRENSRGRRLWDHNHEDQAHAGASHEANGRVRRRLMDRKADAVFTVDSRDFRRKKCDDSSAARRYRDNRLTQTDRIRRTEGRPEGRADRQTHELIHEHVHTLPLRARRGRFCPSGDAACRWPEKEHPYPEGLKQTLVCNVPWIAEKFWNSSKMFFPARDVAKVKVRCGN
eukprot:6197760-Pleurochrysis_carterae.AAC.1